ncbi:MAG: FMN-binding negative transcriptional regulator [Cypionkella sp.]|uniref:FMN-binding negative transcriptional regulator n=1 Tax=Cypionkella sp. TaxID=2811411 RepID=UPI00262889B6|nr:FMN-binding negative transcriptional regulator [Cypionkella sp.]MDB5658898.1 FMN-binding negative transcriptional regulator [Cypionkella sp.]
MHPNPAFRSTPLQDNLAFAQARGFGILSVNGADGPLAAHVPFLISPDAGFAELHLARSNPVGQACLEGPVAAVIMVSGPDAYISPDWYGSDDQVPTWNYIAVHLRGLLSALPEAALHPHVDALSAEHENRLLPKTPWQSSKMSQGAMPRMLRMILPFRFEIGSVEGTWKLNQNKTPEVRRGAVDHLAQQSDAGSQAIAALMRRDLE